VQHSQTARLLETVSVSNKGALDLRGFHPLGRIFLDLLSPTANALQTALCTTIPRFQVPSTADSSIGCSLFTRRYLGNHCCFLFLRLMICLSSARSPTLQRWSIWNRRLCEESSSPRIPQLNPRNSTTGGADRRIGRSCSAQTSSHGPHSQQRKEGCLVTTPITQGERDVQSRRWNHRC